VSYLVFAMIVSAVTFVPVVGPISGADMWKKTGLLQHVVGITIACVLHDVNAYCVAFAFAFTFTSLVTIAHDRGLVNYNACVGFSVSSASLYAILRIVSRIVVSETVVASWFSHLLPFVISSMETIGMYVSANNGYYTFSSDSYLFMVYAHMKATLFLALPRLEDTLTDNYATRTL
jgi:hypothetical protein